MEYCRACTYPKVAVNVKFDKKYSTNQNLTRDKLLKEFYSKTELMDNQRNQNWKETFPELKEILK